MVAHTFNIYFLSLDPKQVSYVSVRLDIEEFEQYDLDVETVLTCTLKDIKVHFSDSH